MTSDRVHAPEIPRSLEWLNVDEPLWLADQRGRVVLLDFWCYGCINSLHIEADLRHLQQKYPDDLTVIGVHSPKFPHEKVTAQLQKAVNRLYIQHPVVSDPELKLAQQYALKSWPSVVVIDPEGYIVGVTRGDGKRRQLDALIADLLAKRAAEPILEPLQLHLRPEPVSPLRFPGKVHASEARLFISDSGRNRVLECDLAGRVRRIFGSGSPGLVDGDGQYTSFNNPQGLVRVEDDLFVADAGNHAIRRIRLDSGEVETLAGTGERDKNMPERFDAAAGAALNTPWDLAYRQGILYIAMTGQHQIWQLPFTSPGFSAYAGSGKEDLLDGPARAASFAQPSGLAMLDEHLFVADAASSTIRVVRMPTHSVATVVGSRGEFGDHEGMGRDARLQHPQGVAADGNRELIWIADSYNSKLKTLALRNNRVSDFNIYHPLNEPGGLCVLGDDLFIANTNAHEILRVNIPSRAVQVLDIDETAIE